MSTAADLTVAMAASTLDSGVDAADGAVSAVDMWEPSVPLVVTAADVEVSAELVHRLTRGAAALATAATGCGRLLTTTRWTGEAADAGLREAQALSCALTTLGDRLGNLAVRAAHQRDQLAGELTWRRLKETAVLELLGRVTRVPGDLEIQLRGDLAQFRHTLPVSGHHLWPDLHRTLVSLLP